jgi:5-methylcytosine-specific restriction protein A
MKVHRSPWAIPSPRAVAEAHAKYDRDKRDKWTRRLYSTARWERLRKHVLREQPVCATPACDKPAAHVDHIRPHEGNSDVFFDRANLQGLCHGCHSRKTRRERL